MRCCFNWPKVTLVIRGCFAAQQSCVVECNLFRRLQWFRINKAIANSFVSLLFVGEWKAFERMSEKSIGAAQNAIHIYLLCVHAVVVVSTTCTNVDNKRTGASGKFRFDENQFRALSVKSEFLSSRNLALASVVGCWTRRWLSKSRAKSNCDYIRQEILCMSKKEGERSSSLRSSFNDYYLISMRYFTKVAAANISLSLSHSMI